MLKRLLSVLLGALCVLLLTAPSLSARIFSDTKQTVFLRAFDALSRQGIVHGFADGTARPLDFLTRAQAVKLLVDSQSHWRSRVQFFAEHPAPIALFRGVPQGHWVIPALETAFAHALVTGYSDGTFKPDALISTEEVITLLARTFGDIDDAEIAMESPYLMNIPGQWYTAAFNSAIRKNLILPQTAIRPGYAITRGQFVDMLYRRWLIARTGKSVFTDDGGLKQLPRMTNMLQEPNSKIQESRTVSSGQATSKMQTVNVEQLTDSQLSFTLSIPAIGIANMPISHPKDPFTEAGLTSVLKNGIGHLFSCPGAGGKMMLYGHSSGFPGDFSPYTKAFRTINKLQAGDTITVSYQGKLYTYQVTTKQTVKASDTSPFKDDGSGEELLLYTCWPPDSVSERYIVHAVPL